MFMFYSTREEGLTTSDGDPDPQIRDPDQRIFTGIQIRDPGSVIRPYFQRIWIRDPREKQCGSFVTKSNDNGYL